MDIGNKILFGNYEWLVLSVIDDKALIITEDIIEQRDYHDKSSSVTWADCELRHYLNHEFYDSFKKEDKERIIPTMNINKGNPWYKTEGGEDTVDKIFILSMDEVVRDYFGDSSRLLDHPAKNQRYWFQRKDENNIKRRALYKESIWWWWVRTPGKHHRVAVYIHGDGNIGIQGNGISKTTFNTLHRITKSNKGGVRPALWLSL